MAETPVSEAALMLANQVLGQFVTLGQGLAVALDDNTITPEEGIDLGLDGIMFMKSLQRTFKRAGSDTRHEVIRVFKRGELHIVMPDEQ